MESIILDVTMQEQRYIFHEHIGNIIFGPIFGLINLHYFNTWYMGCQELSSKTTTKKQTPKNSEFIDTQDICIYN